MENRIPAKWSPKDLCSGWSTDYDKKMIRKKIKQCMKVKFCHNKNVYICSDEVKKTKFQFRLQAFPKFRQFIGVVSMYFCDFHTSYFITLYNVYIKFPHSLSVIYFFVFFKFWYFFSNFHTRYYTILFIFFFIIWHVYNNSAQTHVNL